MARFVREIMNPEVLSVRSDTGPDEVLARIVGYGITAVAVLDDERRPLGMRTLRDILGKTKDNISAPALTTTMDASLEDAARAMAESGRHHLVVVGSDGRAVGMLSSLDLVRAFIGRPPEHPNTFSHFDSLLGVTWSNPRVLDLEHARSIPDEAGVFVLSAGGVGRSEVDLWADSTARLRDRLVEMVGQGKPTAANGGDLARALARSDLRFRYATVSNTVEAARVARRIQDRIAAAPLPRDL